jgi:hypothetical protein
MSMYSTGLNECRGQTNVILFPESFFYFFEGRTNVTFTTGSDKCQVGQMSGRTNVRSNHMSLN